jgi:hypothetical protein
MEDANRPDTNMLTQQDHNSATYKYLKIIDEKTIRVLTLYPGRPDSKLAGELNFKSLNENPVYEAVSYVWGDPTRCEEMICGGEVLGLTQSLADALCRLRDESMPRYIWADQICINQYDQVEKSKQVKLMNRIYKDTAKVLAWLGRDNHGYAQSVFDFIKCLNVAFKDEEQLQQFTEDQQERLHQFPAEEWEPIAHMYRLPWVSTTSCFFS